MLFNLDDWKQGKELLCEDLNRKLGKVSQNEPVNWRGLITIPLVSIFRLTFAANASLYIDLYCFFMRLFYPGLELMNIFDSQLSLTNNISNTELTENPFLLISITFGLLYPKKNMLLQ